MEDDDRNNNSGDATPSLPPTPDTPTDQAKKPNKPRRTSKKSDDDKKKSYRRSWRSASPIRKIEIILGALVAAGAIGYLGVTIWGNLQTKWNFEKDQRSYITMIKADMLNQPEIGKPVDFQLTLENSGKTDALNSWEQSVSTVGAAVTLNAPTGQDRVESGVTIPPRRPYVVSVKTAPLTKEQMDAITQGKFCIYAGGYASYRDIFGDWRQSVFCGFYKSGIEWSPQHTGIALCSHNNRIIWNGAEAPAVDGSHTTKCQD